MMDRALVACIRRVVKGPTHSVVTGLAVKSQYSLCSYYTHRIIAGLAVQSQYWPCSHNTRCVLPRPTSRNKLYRHVNQHYLTVAVVFIFSEILRATPLPTSMTVSTR